MNDRTEASVTVVGKVIYTAIGDKTGPYFSLPGARYVSTAVSICCRLLLMLFQMPGISSDEMAKAKVGFAVRFTNRDFVVDTLLPDILSAHNQAVIEYFLTVREKADARLGTCVTQHRLLLSTAN